jgi:hypothetical protein
MRAVDSPRGSASATLSSLRGKRVVSFLLINPLSTEGEERVVERSDDRVSQRGASSPSKFNHSRTPKWNHPVTILSAGFYLVNFC